MKGTIRVNGELVKMHPYGCWNRSRQPTVTHSQDSTVTWPHRMSFDCRYDLRETDERCYGCNKPWDTTYVESLK